jgi:hypothetical protein
VAYHSKGAGSDNDSDIFVNTANAITSDEVVTGT